MPHIKNHCISEISTAYTRIEFWYGYKITENKLTPKLTNINKNFFNKLSNFNLFNTPLNWNPSSKKGAHTAPWIIEKGISIEFGIICLHAIQKHKSIKLIKSNIVPFKKTLCKKYSMISKENKAPINQ